MKRAVGGVLMALGGGWMLLGVVQIGSNILRLADAHRSATNLDGLIFVLAVLLYLIPGALVLGFGAHILPKRQAGGVGLR